MMDTPSVTERRSHRSSPSNISKAASLLSLLLLPSISYSTKHSFKTSNDGRFFISPIGSPYGFIKSGQYNLTVYDFEIIERRSNYQKKGKTKHSWFGRGKTESSSTAEKVVEEEGKTSFEAGFLLKRFESESDFARFEDEIIEDPSTCAFDFFRTSAEEYDLDDDEGEWLMDDLEYGEEEEEEDDEEEEEYSEDLTTLTVEDDGIFLSMKDKSKWKRNDNNLPAPSVAHTFTLSEEGLYFLIYQICPTDTTALFTEVRSSFSLDISMHNYDKLGKISYLTAGEMPLPGMYFYFTVSYLICLIFWTKNIRDIASQNNSDRRRRGPGVMVHQIHHMMSIVIFLKTISIFFESVRYHYIGTTGHAELWSVVYFTLTFLKGIMLFTVILLIGSGWSFVKPFLHNREKKIIFLVLILQIIDNIAVIVLTNETEGERQYDDWSAILHLVDILCCCAVLVPIVWQINTLEQSVDDSGDNEATGQNNTKTVHKLKLFRSFYLLVIAYIYFTRVVVYLFATVLGYRHTWLRYFITELGTLVFYVVVGFKFRPLAENPYMELVNRRDDNEDVEIEMANAEQDSLIDRSK